MALPPARRGWQLEARGRLEMQKWAQVAEESGSMGTPESSMPSDAFRTGAHVTLAPVRIWHAETNDSEHRH